MDSYEHKHFPKDEEKNMCRSCGTALCATVSPDGALNCTLQEGHDGLHVDPRYPEYGKWGKKQ